VFSNETNFSYNFDKDFENCIIFASQNLKGNFARIFMAKIANSLGKGGQRLAETMFDWCRDTIRKGQEELKTEIYNEDQFSLRGRKKTEDIFPTLEKDIKEIVDPSSQADPTFKTDKIYTPLTVNEVYQRLIDLEQYRNGYFPTPRTINNILNNLNYHPQTVLKTKELKKIPETNAIFEEVFKQNKWADETEGVLRLSMDAKAKLNIGEFSRRGKSRQGAVAYDHDFLPDTTLQLFGIYAPATNDVNFYFHEGNLTADFMIDCLQRLWDKIPTKDKPKTLALNLDNGPENSSSRTQFIKRLVEFKDKNNVGIHLIYYPPYHSKYNPVERVWGILEKHWNGEILLNIEKTLGLARSMRYNSMNPNVEFINGVYPKGVSLKKDEMKFYEKKLSRLVGLGKWFLVI
jgi:hypothetical protein